MGARTAATSAVWLRPPLKPSSHVAALRGLAVLCGRAFSRDLVLRGAEERLAPILMTGLTTALALLPIIAGGNKPAHELEHPMAVVIFGGVLTSTLLNLFVAPAPYLRWGRREKV